jgi:hypothetical protein
VKRIVLQIYQNKNVTNRTLNNEIPREEESNYKFTFVLKVYFTTNIPITLIYTSVKWLYHNDINGFTANNKDLLLLPS